jgi:hypothetical protein
VGLIVSLVALGRQPRGFAIAGVILGLLGTCGGLIVLVAVIIAGAAAVAAVLGIVMFSNPERLELTRDMATIAIAVESYRDDNGVPPASLTLLDLREPTLIDPWGNPYRYVLVEENKFDLISNGRDSQPETDDDVRLSRLDEYWDEAGDDLEEQIRELEQAARRGGTGESAPPGGDSEAGGDGE